MKIRTPSKFQLRAAINRRKSPHGGTDARRRKSPSRIDPSRTLALRRQFAAKIRRQFDRLKGQIVKLVVDEDAFGLRGLKETTTANLTSGSGSGREAGSQRMATPPLPLANGNLRIAVNVFMPLPDGVPDGSRFEQDYPGGPCRFVDVDGFAYKDWSPEFVDNAFCATGEGGEHRYSSTQFDLTGDPLPKILALQDRIADDDLAGKGKEDEIHVTVRYGLTTKDPEEVRRLVSGFGIVEIELGKTSFFPATESSDGADVVKIDVVSSELERLNRLLASLDHVETHAGYSPHVTLAYVKAGLGPKYTGDDSVARMKMSLTDLVFSDPDGEKTVISLMPALNTVPDAQRTVGIDFDGTITNDPGVHDFNRMTLREGAKDGLKKLRAAGFKVVIFTANPDPPGVRKKLKEWGIDHDGVKKKMEAVAYVDDKSIHATSDKDWEEDLLPEVVEQVYGEPKQPISDADNYDDLKDMAKGGQDELEGLLAKLGYPMVRYQDLELGDLEVKLDKPGGLVVLAPQKGEERAEEKVKSDYDGDWSRLLDVVRAAVLTDSMQELRDAADQLLSWVEESGGSLARLPKDRFKEPMANGYRDLLVNYRLSSGFVVEVIFCLKPIWIARERDHNAYDVVRAIKAAMEHEGREEMTPGEAEAVRRIKEGSKTLYARAWEECKRADGVLNAFCATGEGGGEDNSCSSRHEIVKDDGLRYSTKFEVGDRQFFFDAEHGGGGHWDIGFGLESKRGSSEGTSLMTHDPNTSPIKVLRGVQTSLSQFIKDKQPRSMEFTAAKSEPSRVVFYDRISKEIGKSYGYSVDVRDLPAMKEYTLTRNAFCPTGEGGGVDPSCSPKVRSSGKLRAGNARAKRYLEWLEGEAHVPMHGVTVHVLKNALPQAFGDGKGGARVNLPHILFTDPELKDQAGRTWRHELQHARDITDKRDELTRDQMEKRARDAERSEVRVKAQTRNALIDNTRWKFHTTSEQVEAFKAWLKQQVQSQIRGQTMDQLWQQYIMQGYAKGQGRAFEDATAAEKALGQTMGEPMDFFEGTKAQFLRSAFANPISIDRVKQLAGRVFTELDGVTQLMAIRMSRTLLDGLVQGQSPRDIGRDLSKAVDVGRERALTIARTEIIRAHAEGQLDGFDALGIEEVGAAVEWSTADDEDVCPDCEQLDGVVLTTDEARGMLPQHPNCRCAWIPANVGEDTKGQKRSKSAISTILKVVGAVTGSPLSTSRPKSILNIRHFGTDGARLWPACPWPGYTWNAFCPTGKGGGVDPSCSHSEKPKYDPPSKKLVEDAVSEAEAGNVRNIRELKWKLVSVPVRALAGSENPIGDSPPRKDIASIIKKNPSGLHPPVITEGVPEGMEESKHSKWSVEDGHHRVNEFRKAGHKFIWALQVYNPKGKEPLTYNAFCPTGPGGGQDNSCSPGKGQPHPPVGGTFEKTYKGQKIKVEVTHDGYKIGDKVHKSLTAAAKAVRGTDTPINGWAFFGLTKAAPQSLLPLPPAVTTPSPTTEHGLGSVLSSVAKDTGYSKEQLKAGLSSDMEMRTKVTGSIFKSGSAVENAVTQVVRGNPNRVVEITSGLAGGPVKEFSDTPKYDLDALTKITVHKTALGGEALANLGSRQIEVGSTTRPGSYRHELGHVLRGSLGGSSYSNKNTMTEAISDEYKKVMDRVKADPAGLKTKMPHEWYEEKYGVAGRRSLDNWEENFAEHYRLYHREIYRDKYEGGDGKFLEGYRKRHPGMAKIFDAHYTTALLKEHLGG
jgi:SPP1 gp7 family putative phage head morphogenesis protein